MRYLLKNVNNQKNSLSASLSPLYINKKKNNLLIFNKKSKFGYVKYKKRLSRSNFFNTKYSNIYFSKTRKVKSAITDIKILSYSIENGYFIELLLVGLGYKVTIDKVRNMLFFELHFSHKLYFLIPDNIIIACIKKKLVLFSSDKAHLINIAEKIKALRFPNTYKGKGIKYFDEILKLKPGKQR